MASVYAVGMAVMDFVFDVNVFPDVAQKYRASDAAVIGGGCASNAAYAVARLGGDARLGSRIGDDLVGDLIVADLEKTGVDTTGCDRSGGGRSSFSSVLVDASGERQIVNFRGADLTEDTSWIGGAADAVLVDNRWSAGARAGLALAADLGVPGVVDAESPVDGDAISLASHIAFSRNGLADFAKTEDISAGLSSAHRAFGCTVIVTNGGDGAYLWQEGSVRHIPGFAVDVRDTLAAGDIWHGAFALGLAEGTGVIDAILFANAAAALKCREFGGRAGCPDRSTVEAFIKEMT